MQTAVTTLSVKTTNLENWLIVGVDRYVSGVKMKMNAKIYNNKSSDKKTFFKCF